MRIYEHDDKHRLASIGEVATFWRGPHHLVAPVTGQSRRRPVRPARFLGFFLLAAPLIAGCDTSPTESEVVEEVPALIEGLPRALSVAESEAVDASTRFGLRLLQEMADQEPQADHFLSPLSASMALGMVLNAASGATFDSLLQTLGREGSTLDEVNDSYRQIMDLLLGLDRKVSTSLVNLVLHDQGPEFVPGAAFQARVRHAFGARVQGGDFRDMAFAASLNGWAREQTGGKIDRVVPEPIGGPSQPEGAHVFVNALHFEGDWRQRFDPSKSYRGEFRQDHGEVGRATFMVGGRGNRFWEDPQRGQALELPYGGDAFVMTILLPPAGESMADYLRNLDEGHWAQIEAGLRAGNMYLGEVHLPRWQMEWGRSLLPTLEERFGLSVVGAFPGLNPSGHEDAMEINDLTQRTTLRVDERGTEATAVTTVRIRSVSTPVVQEPLRINRPFVFAIRERHSGAVLFLGVVRNPPTD